MIDFSGDGGEALPAVAAGRVSAARPRSTGLARMPLAMLLLHGVLMLSMLGAAVIDIPRAARAGRMTALGAISVTECIAGAVAILLARGVTARVAVRVAPYAAFMAWVAVSATWRVPGTEGLQNAAVYLSLLVLLTAAAVATTEDRDRAERVIDSAVLGADVIALTLVAASLVLRGWPTNIDAVPWFVHPRALALFGLVPLSWHLARWALGYDRHLIGASLWMVAIFVSLSRTATAAGVLLVVLAALVRGRRQPINLRSSLLIMASVPVLVAGALTVTPFRVRIFGKDARGASTSELELSDNGRRQMWAAIVESAAEAPFLGKGLASSEAVVSDKYKWVGHPHNDFLRVWHDLGLLGVALLLLSLAVWARTAWRDFWRPRHVDAHPPVLQLASIGALIALVAGMLTDNPLVYGFVMAPTAVVVGGGLGASSRKVRRIRRRRADDEVTVTPPAVSTDSSARPAVEPELTRGERRRRRRRRRSRE